MIVALLASAALGSTPPPLPGDTMRPFVVQTRAGAHYEWSPGRVTVVCFCAMWCNTWKDQLPRLLKAESELKGLPVSYLAISVDGRWMDRVKGAQYANLLADPGGAWSASIGINRVPYTLVVDVKGRIRSSRFGVLRSDDVVNDVRGAMRALSAGTIYLTFDGVSDEILDVLRAKGVSATFFVDSDGPIVERARREGHSVQTLGPRPTGTSTLSRSEGTIRGKEGKPLHLFVDDPFDLSRPGEAELERRIANLARTRAVVYLHAGVGETVDMVPRVIENLRSRGFEFEILGGATRAVK